MLVEHHIKYKEIHGVDETVWMERKDHRKLHERLRKEGKCKVPTKTLETIANKAYSRTLKSKEQHKLYNSQYIRRTSFETLLDDGIAILEVIRINTFTGYISFYVYAGTTKHLSTRIRI